MKELILIRHGETNKNVQGNIHDPNDPEQLNLTGIGQMQHAAQRVLSMGVERVYSSNQLRAIQSGQIVADTLHLPLTVVEGMQERQWGNFAGKPWLEVEALLEQMPLGERFVYTPPGGESWESFESRLVAAITKISSENPNKTVVVVTHGGAIRALIPHLLAVSREESFKYQPKNASLTIFDFSGTTVRLVNMDK